MTRTIRVVGTGLLVMILLLSCNPPGRVPMDPKFPDSRDPRSWPFAADSIWNMPLHRNAQLLPAGIMGTGSVYTDDDVIILTPGAPLTAVYENFKDWSTQQAGARCESEGKLLARVPIPSDLIIPHEQGTPNMSAAVLMPDGLTIHQSQPFHRCEAGWYATSHYVYPEDNIVSGDGIRGAHGGSGMSSLGGTIRVGELVPGGTIRHALKIGIYANKYLSYQGDTPGYRWPAVQADGYAGDCSGDPTGCYAGSNLEMEMGALLALPPDFAVSTLQTEPARILAQAFQSYGAYVTDDTHWDATILMTEWGPAGRVRDEFKQVWGFDFSGGSSAMPWLQDLDTIFKNLHVVTNNSAQTIGGGPNESSSRRAPFAPAFDPAKTTARPATVKIMPLGDSLTEGAYPNDHHSWRGYLRARLIAEGYTAIDFVGDRYLQAHGDVEPFDLEHAGHGGYTIGPDRVQFCDTCETSGVYEHIESWLDLSDPNVILILLGINDLFSPELHGKDFAQSAPQRLEALVDRIHSLRPEAVILLSSLLQVGWTDGTDWPEYLAINAGAAEIAKMRTYVHFVDLNAIELQAQDYTDDLHLSESGAKKIAEGWFQALVPLLQR